MTNTSTIKLYFIVRNKRIIREKTFNSNVITYNEELKFRIESINSITNMYGIEPKLVQISFLLN